MSDYSLIADSKFLRTECSVAVDIKITVRLQVVGQSQAYTRFHLKLVDLPKETMIQKSAFDRVSSLKRHLRQITFAP
jgi:hypothetical protein